MDDVVGSLEFVTVKTTLPSIPLPPHASRQPVLTERLILRSVSPDDLETLHVLRTQPEVMRWSGAGRVDRDLDETREKIAHNLPPNDADNYDFSICLRPTGQWIGIGGCMKAGGDGGDGHGLGWPEVGYMLHKDFWGKGYATEFVAAFLDAWWSLPRSECEISVEKATVNVRGGGGAGAGGAGGAVVEGEGKGLLRERIAAVTAEDNYASQKVLRKWGFEKVKVWKEVDENSQNEVILVGYCTVQSES